MNDEAFLPVVAAWCDRVTAALKFKNKRFEPEAREGMQFFNGPYDFWFEGLRSDRWFRVPNDPLSNDSRAIMVTVNKVAELVQIFGPVLYHANPFRLVTPRSYPKLPMPLFGNVQDPNSVMQFQMMQQQETMARMADDARGMLLQAYLNFTPDKLDLKTHMRRAVDEAIIKGMGTMWTETYRPPGSPFQMVGSFYDSVDNLVIDPQAKTIENAKWVARRCVHPVWEVERMYGYPPGYLAPQIEQNGNSSSLNVTELGPWSNESGDRDMVVYWKVYSKMGIGGRLPRVMDIDPQYRANLDLFGDFCYVVVMNGLKHPLNLPPWLFNRPQGQGFVESQKAVQWPTPFWTENGWPFTQVAFHEIPNDPWPMSHLTPGMGELKFLNWAYSKMVNKIQTTCRDLIVTANDLEGAVKDWITTGKDLEVVGSEMVSGRKVSELIEFLQHPQWNNDIWKVVEAIADQFDRRTGLTELMYGISTRQVRVAADVEQRADAGNVRPEDMANKVEEAASAIARKEILAARWHLAPRDVQPVLGPTAAMGWQNLIYVTDPGVVIYNLFCRVESNSARKPNLATMAENMNQAMQNLFQPLLQLASATGQIAPVNALIEDWGRALQLPSVERYLIPPPPMPLMPPAGGPAPGGPPGQAA